MIEIIQQQNFKKIAWKNGQGFTIELAISEGGTLDQFGWRLSMAAVVEEGLFSDFSGYQRRLLLTQGTGLELTHDQQQVDRLDSALQMASFDGASHTYAKLKAGPIEDFNLMFDPKMYRAKVKTSVASTRLQLDASELCFAYSLNEQMRLTQINEQPPIKIPTGDLLKINSLSDQCYWLEGQQIILIYLNKK